MIPTSDFLLPTTGAVLRPFPFRFQFPITESVELFTDIITAADGTEQRVAIRDPADPRQHVAATVIVFDRDELEQLKALLFGWNLKQYGVPLWFHAMQLAEDASADDTSLNVGDCDGRDLTDRLADEDDVPVLLWRAHDDWEPAILTAAADGVLSLAGGITRDWPAGETWVLPLKLMLIVTDPMQMDTPANAIAQLDLEFVSATYTVSAEIDDDSASMALMVRPIGVMRVVAIHGTILDHESDNAGSFFPQMGDTPHDLFGFTTGIASSAQAAEGSFPVPGVIPTGPPYSASKGRATGFSKCTCKAPDYFHTQVLGAGLSDIPGGVGDDAEPVVGTDYTVSVYKSYVSAGPDYPAGLNDPGTFIIGSGFSGAGYFPPPGAPVARTVTLLLLSLMGGVARAFANSAGSNITSYGRYDMTVIGGVRSYSVDASETAFNTTFLDVQHGFCIRLQGIAAFKGVKVVTEEVLYEMDGVTETGTFGSPNVTTHDFTSDDYTAADTGDPIPGFFFVVECGGTTVFGGTHDAVGDEYNGYAHGTDKDLFRVTVSLYDAADVDHQQFIDIFPTMLVAMTIGS